MPGNSGPADGRPAGNGGKGQAADRDELFGRFCVEQGYLNPEQLAEAYDARKSARELGMAFGLPEVAVSKKLLTREQCEEVMRVVRVHTGEARLLVGEKGGGYEVVSKLGEGGMGVVYRARSVSSGEYVALKVLPPSLAREGTLLKRFRREAELTRTLEHENIVRCVELGFDRERKLHFCALELIEGEDLGKRLRRDGKIPGAEAVEVTRQIARAIEHASLHDLIHRDIKPQNIMLTPEGTAKLLDLGLARSVSGGDTRLTQTGAFAGSPHYASPEQARGEREIDVRTDIYSLGATLYHMVTGQTPFSGESAAAVLAQVMKGRLPWPADVSPDVSESACRLVVKMMMKGPGDRYQTPAELLQDIDLVIAGRELPPPEFAPGKAAIMRPGARLSFDKPTTRAARRRAAPAPEGPGRKAALVAGALGMVAVVIAAVFIFSGGEERPALSRPKVPRRTAGPTAPSGGEALAERERKLEEMFEFAKKHLEEHPDEFERAIRYLERVRDEGRGTRFELMADSEVAATRRRWRKAARKAFEAAAKKARKLAASGDIDSALAALAALPGGLVPALEREVREEAAKIVDAARRRGESIVSEVEGRLARGDTDGARAALDGLRGFRYENKEEAVAAKLKELETEIDAAEKAKKAKEAARAGDALPRLLAEFDGFVKRGRFAEARDRMRRAAGEKANALIAGTLKAAGWVAGALQERRDAIMLAAEGLVGKTVSLRTAGGVRKGEVEGVDDLGLRLATKVIINKQVRGVTRFAIRWAELAPREEEKLAKAWKPVPPEGDVARAFIALAREDADAAQDALDAAGDHPLSGLVRERIAALRLVELESAAKGAWLGIERRAGTGKLSEANAKRILEEIAAFEKEYGATKLAASVADGIRSIRERAEQTAGRWIRIPPGKLRVEHHGGATSSVVGDTLAVRVQQGKGDHARIPILLAGTDFRLRFAYRGPMLEMFLRKSWGWRGCLLILLTRDAIVVRTYPAEDDRKPDVLTVNRGKNVLADDWHLVEATLKESAFVLTVDGNAVSATQGLPFVGTGEAYIQVWNTQGDTFQLRDVSFATGDEPSGAVAGLVTGRDKAGSWIELKADDEAFARRYVPLEDAAGRFARDMAGTVGKIFTPNRANLAWKLQGGQRRVVGLDMQYLSQGETGLAAGVVTDAGKHWFELTPADDRRDRYVPRWIGGMPAAGGGPEQAIVRVISRLSVGDRIKVDWVYDHRKRAVKVELVQGGGHTLAPRIAPGLKFRDTFEKSTSGWSVVRFAPQVIGDLSIARGQGKEGRSALALRYAVEPGKLPLVMRHASDINRLSLWIRTLKRPAEVVVGAHEKDESWYQTHVHLEPADGWRRLDLDLATFKLGDDSEDENDFLDFDQIKSVSIIDAAGMLGGTGDNVLLIDDVVGEYRGPAE